MESPSRALPGLLQGLFWPYVIGEEMCLPSLLGNSYILVNLLQQIQKTRMK